MLHGLSPTSLVVDEGKLALGLATETDFFGIERSTVSLVRTDSAPAGRLCDLATAFHLRRQDAPVGCLDRLLGFLDAAERTWRNLALQEYRQAKEVAASLIAEVIHQATRDHALRDPNKRRVEGETRSPPPPPGCLRRSESRCSGPL